MLPGSFSLDVKAVVPRGAGSMFEEYAGAGLETRVLVVSDDERTLRSVAARIPRDLEAVPAHDLASALALLGSCGVAVVDMRMPGMGGRSALGVLRDRSPEVEIVGLAPHRAGDGPAMATADGAYDVLQLPLGEGTVRRMLARAVEQRRLRLEVARLHRELDERHGLSSLVGSSDAIAEAFRQLALAASSDASVLLTGEAGTGKMAAARAIHHQSARRAGRFVYVPCRAVTASLFEGAALDRRGRRSPRAVEPGGPLAAAFGGTLYLDDVDALPHAAQTGLWAMLPDAAARDGSPGIRIVASSRHDLVGDARPERFRRDLLQRLAELHVHLPPLRLRLGDVPALATHFARRAARATRPAVTGLSPGALQALGRYPWPGNVAELEAVMERAVAGAAGPMVEVDDLPDEIRSPLDPSRAPSPVDLGPYRQMVERSTSEASRRYLVALLTEHQGNITAAARRAGVERETLHRLLARFGLRAQDFRSDRQLHDGRASQEHGTRSEPSHHSG